MPKNTPHKPTASPASVAGAARQGSPSLPAKAIQQPVSKQAGTGATRLLKQHDTQIVSGQAQKKVSDDLQTPLKPSSKDLVASYLGCRPEDLLVFREEGNLVIAITPDGRKFKFIVEPNSWDLKLIPNS